MIEICILEKGTGNPIQFKMCKSVDFNDVGILIDSNEYIPKHESIELHIYPFPFVHASYPYIYIVENGKWKRVFGEKP